MLNNVKSIRDIIKTINASSLINHYNAFIANNLNFVKTARS